MKNADKPAYPFKLEGEGYYAGKTKQHEGLTKREMFAMAAMQGMLANPEIMNHTSGFPSARSVVEYADTILKSLES